MRSSSLVLLSGGLDSLAAFRWAYEESDLMLCLTFNYGQKAAKKEIEAASSICRKYDIQHRVIDLPWYTLIQNSALINAAIPFPSLSVDELEDKRITERSAKAVWVPNRNGVFINIAAGIAEAMLANWVVVGFNKEEGETFPDNSKDYFEAANKALSYSTNNQVSLMAPMLTKDKKEIVQWALKKKIDLSLLWSCYGGGDQMCGKCESCLRCRRALEMAEATQYLKKFF